MRIESAILKSASTFVLMNLLAGVANYFFQVTVARNLPVEEFAVFTDWFAHLSMFLVLGSFAQYQANFNQSHGRTLQWTVIGALGLSILSGWMAIYLFATDGALVMSVVLVAICLGWMVGQLQGRFLYFAVALIGVLSALTRLSIAQGGGGNEDLLRFFKTAVFFSHLPPLLLGAWLLLKLKSRPQNQADRANQSGRKWLAPIILSVLVVTVPQLDTVLLVRILPMEVFQNYSMAAMFSKAVFFIFLILAQWLLPRQLTQGSRIGFGRRNLSWGLGGAIVLSFGIALMAPILSQHLLRWQEGPSVSLVFIVTFNVCLLTLLFLQAQASCANGRENLALFAIGGLAFESVIQLILAHSLKSYFVVAIIAQLLLISFIAIIDSRGKSRRVAAQGSV